MDQGWNVFFFWGVGGRYIDIIKKHDLQISQPAVDGAQSWPITGRHFWTGNEVHKQALWAGPNDNCTNTTVVPPCAGYAFCFTVFLFVKTVLNYPCMPSAVNISTEVRSAVATCWELEFWNVSLPIANFHHVSSYSHMQQYC
jgi:hypothetical protein